ncbi:MAG: chemotaxis protein CheR [Betaproteobacteria bacterium]|nr:chemotaxis protein CheR [Betaproteobacteria bacterium]
MTTEHAGDSREFPFAQADFERVRRLIHRHAGIALSPSKRDMVYSRLVRRLRARGLSRFDQYLALLDSGNAAEWQAFTNSLTTNLTSFFREAHHFPILVELAQRARPGRPLKVWCCAASTGEEPYSMAIAIVEAFRSFTPPASILATDVDTGVLARAQEGVYALERLQKVSAERVRQFFLRGRGARAGFARIRPELRALVTFRQLNLLDEAWPVRGPLGAIFCRNVMIYFDRPTQRRILERFAPLLRPDGLLFAGHSESLHYAADLFRLRAKTVYERTHR